MKKTNHSSYISTQKNSRKTILYIMTGAESLVGGISTVNISILQSLNDLVFDNKIKLKVFSLLENDLARPSFLHPDVNFKGFNGNRILFSFNLIINIFRKPVFFFERVGLGLPILIFSITRLVKTIIFAHGSENWSTMLDSKSGSRRQRQNVRKLDRWLLESSSLCLTNSKFTLNKMKQTISKFKGKACPLCLSSDFELNHKIERKKSDNLILEACDGNKYPIGNRMILLVGRMDQKEREKGHYALINVAPDLIKEFPDIQILFAGSGDDIFNLKKIVIKLKISKYVYMTGHVSVDVLDKLYQHCYAYVMPSKQEGFGLAYLEAMNHGKPCIGCFDDGAEEIIIHKETGLLINDPNDKQELCGALKVLLNDPEYSEKLGVSGFKRLHKNFTYKHFSNRIKSSIENFL